MVQGFRILFLPVLVFSCFGCWSSKSVSEVIDDWLFRQAGTTLFSKAEKLSLKEIHLDNGLLMGRQVFVEGTVQRLSELGTFLVISDDGARLLVVLTDLDFVPRIEVDGGRVLQVLGRVESGKKGLPVVRAFSMRIVSVEESRV